MFFFFSSRRRHTRLTCDWSSDVCSSDLGSQKGNPLLFGVDVRLRARRVKKRLQRAGEHTKAAGAEMVRFHAQFRKEFADRSEERRVGKECRDRWGASQ